jgi:hypothetical protein
MFFLPSRSIAKKRRLREPALPFPCGAAGFAPRNAWCGKQPLAKIEPLPHRAILTETSGASSWDGLARFWQALAAVFKSGMFYPDRDKTFRFVQKWLKYMNLEYSLPSSLDGAVMRGPRGRGALAQDFREVLIGRRCEPGWHQGDDHR